MKKEVTVKEIIEFLGEEVKDVLGNIDDIYIKHLKASKDVDEFTLDWIGAAKSNKQIIAENSKAEAILVDKDVFFSNKLKNQGKVIIFVDNPKHSVARVGSEFFVEKPNPGIDATATVHPKAKIGNSVHIGPGSIIGECEIGDKTIIHPNVVVCNNSIIGKDVIIHAGTVIGVDSLGCLREDDGRLVDFPLLGGVIIEDNVIIGANSHISIGTLSNTIIGEGSRINGMSFIGCNCKLGKNTWMTGSSMLAGSIIVEDNVTIFSRVVIREHRRIGARVTIGMGSVVTKDIPKGETWVGTPARKLEK